MIFFDLDGPILDVSQKYYCIYRDILSQNGFKVLSKEKYWADKRDKVSDREILQKTLAGPFLDSYLHERKLLIESDCYLIYDKLQDDVLNVLQRLSAKEELVLVTLRTYPEQLEKQLAYLNLRKYFSTVLSSDALTMPRWRIKYDLILSFVGNRSSKDSILIGDTETDICAGNNLGFKTIAVLNGIRSYKFLLEANPTFFVRSVTEVLSVIL